MEEMKKSTYPQALKSYNDMQEPNESFTIHSGEFTLQGECNKSSIVIKVDGSITYKWIPRKGVVFEGTVLTFDGDRNGTLLTKFDVQINNSNIGVAHICSQTFGSDSDFVISGIIQGVVVGDKAVPVTSVAFSVPNFDKFLGSPVEYERDGTIWNEKNRLQLEDDNYIIIIDLKPNHKELLLSLEETGGYVFLCDGLITKKSQESISYEEICSHEGVLGALAYFLTFLNGQRTSPCILHGIHDGEIKWTDYTNHMIMPNSSRSFRWRPHFWIDGFSNLWRNFFALWKRDLDFLEFAIHWLTESLYGEIYVESRLVSIQNALELIFNWYIVEKMNVIIGRDSENISAANKIRILISRLNIDNKVPASLKSLTTLVAENKDITDGPEAIVLIRNAIVHGNEAKRKRLKAIDAMAKLDAIMLGTEYVVLSLLRILEYEHQYVCACDLKTKPLPWNNQCKN